jgi:hypothetical protein
MIRISGLCVCAWKKRTIEVQMKVKSINIYRVLVLWVENGVYE